MAEHLDTVVQERGKYGTPLGNENAWKVINATAYTWRNEGWGLLDKPSGTNYQGYSIDVIVNVREQQAVDCLGDAEGMGRPQWSVIAWDASFPSRWRPPVPPVDPIPPPPDDDLAARVTKLEQDVAYIFRYLRSI